MIIKFLLLVLSLISSMNTPRTTPPKVSSKITLGAWTEGLYEPIARKLHPEKLVDFEKLTDKKYSIAHYYRGWESLTNPNLIEEFNVLNKSGWTPMLSTNPYFFDQCKAMSKPIYSAIAEGNCDEFIYAAAKNLKKFNEKFYFRFAWEMNNKDMDWSIPRTGSTPTDFIKAWQHIHQIFNNEKVINALWVFCPNIPDVPEASYKVLYHGDKYVDWICLDGYNWGTTQSWSQWNSFSGVFTSPYDTLTSIAPTKPLMLGEVNTTDEGGNKADWYNDMFEQIPRNFPRIKAVVIFNEDKSIKEKVNWKVDVTPETLEAFKKGIHLEDYQ